MRKPPIRDWHLLNGRILDAVPAASVRARGSHDARQLSQAHWLLRRKRDGRFLASLDDSGRMQPMHWQARRHDSALAGFVFDLESGHLPDTLATDRTQTLLDLLGVPADYGERHGLALVAEPGVLWFGGFDRYRRALWLQADAAAAWRRMRTAARAEGVVLEAISGFRSHDYQLGIFQRKLARGQDVDEILAVNAAPGFSEHHSGRALDLSSPGEPAAEESFEDTAAFGWLGERAADFGFAMSYPRDNPHGIVYEPWHWYYLGTAWAMPASRMPDSAVPSQNPQRKSR